MKHLGVCKSNIAKKFFFLRFHVFLVFFTLNLSISSQINGIFRYLYSIFYGDCDVISKIWLQIHIVQVKTRSTIYFCWILPPRFQCPAKVRHPVSPECEKSRQIWLHQSMRRKKLYKWIQCSFSETKLWMTLAHFAHFGKTLIYQRDIYIYFLVKIKAGREGAFCAQRIESQVFWKLPFTYTPNVLRRIDWWSQILPNSSHVGLTRCRTFCRTLKSWR